MRCDRTCSGGRASRSSITDEDLYDMMAALHPLFIAAAGDRGQALDAWISL